jgi:hypothetical protein
LTGTAFLALLLVGVLNGRSEAADFIRGDANSDGEASLADIHYIQRFLFVGGSRPECMNAADADDDGNVDIDDGLAILRHFAKGSSIPSPFPNPGPDPTENEPRPMGVNATECDSYGSGTPLEDDAAKIEILDAVAGGGEDGTAVITVLVSNAYPIAGYRGRIAGGPIEGYVGPTKGVLPIPVDLTDPPPEGREWALDFVGVRGGYVEFGYLRTPPWVSDWLAPGQDVAVAELPVCLKDGTVAGEYPLTLEVGELVDGDSGRSVSPALVSGTLTVLADVAEGAGCTDTGSGTEPFECPPPTPGRAEDVEARFSLGGGSAPPGGTVALPFKILANADAQGYSVSLDFDEEVLQAVGVEPSYLKPDGSDYGFWAFHVINDNRTPGNGGVDEGTVVAAAVLSFHDSCNSIPANIETEAFDLLLRVNPGADAGTTEIRFLDGGRSLGEPVYNALTAFGGTVRPELANSFLFVSGRVSVLPDGSFFIRGDSNGDWTVDISDAQTTLGYLFLGSESLFCHDAADANDDGLLNVADPVSTLQFLYLGGAPLPPPNTPGEDPTPDSLRCFFRE